MDKLFSLFKYRELVKNLVMKELRLRHKRSFLGLFWSVLNPLLMMVVFSIVFSKRFGIEKYPAFIMTGLLPWNFFAVALANSVHSLITNGGLIKQVYFPRAIIPISTILAYLINFLFACIPLGLLLIVFKVKIGPALLFLPLVILGHLLFTIGLGLIISSLNVFYRDVAEMLEVATLAWFFLTPVIYSREGISGILSVLYRFNPMFYFIELYHQILYSGAALPSFGFLISAYAWAFVSLIAGWTIFHRLEPAWTKEL
jgi:ABC-2 type transport system permease protein